MSAAQYPLTIQVPITGEVLLRIDGIEGLHPVGKFEQLVPVEFAAGPGEVSFAFSPEMWNGIQNRITPGGGV